MSDPQTDFAALIGSRLCHDLVSPLGAISNGLELMQMTQGDSPEMELMGGAVSAALGRVKLFRLGFGQAKTDQQVSQREFVEAVKALEANGRISCACQLSAALPRLTARRLTLAALCVETALAYGGAVTITDTQVHATADRFKFDEPLWEALISARVPTELSSSNVHFALLMQSGAVEVIPTATELTIRL